MVCAYRYICVDMNRVCCSGVCIQIYMCGYYVQAWIVCEDLLSTYGYGWYMWIKCVLMNDICGSNLRNWTIMYEFCVRLLMV